MRYVRARVDEARHERIYRIYMSDGLRVIGGLDVRYVDLLDAKSQKEQDANKIIDRLKGKLNALRDEE